MGAMTLPAEGGCRCSQLQFRVTKPPLTTMICHCPGCQRMTGSAFSTTAMIPDDGFEVTAGTSVAGGLRGPQVHHRHCPDCMSWVFTTFEGDNTRVNLRATMLDDTNWFVPFIECYTSTKLSWANVHAAHSFEEFPPSDQRATLLAEFAATQMES